MSKVYLFPISVFILFHFTFIGTYILAILDGHVVPAVPYISDTATDSPESCVFGQFVNIGSALVGIVFYIRYRQIEKLAYHHSELVPNVAKWNITALWVGISAAFGCSITANFQETNVYIIHFIGAFICFGMTTIYFWIQALITYRIRQYIGSMILAHFRLLLAIFCTIFFVSATVTAIISYSLYKGDNPRKWYPSDGGWEYHVASSISEWILACVISFYILSFTSEFHNISITHPTVSLAGYETIRCEHDIPDALVY